MKRDAIIDDLHKLRERIGRAHGFDVDRIAATIRKHEREASVTTAPTAPRRKTRAALGRSRKASRSQLRTAGAGR